MLYENIHNRVEEEAHEVVRLPASIVYTAIKQEGDDELARPWVSLWWSGLAAGFAIFLSVIGKGAFYSYLGNSSILVHLGYCMGFLVVILGRFHLYTENTITAVIPLLAHFSGRTLLQTCRVWTIVFVANLIGVFISAWVCINTTMVSPDITQGIVAISSSYMDRTAQEFFSQGIPAGFIIAAIVWMMPSSRKGNEFWVIMTLTFLISLGGMTHVIAGAGEAFVDYLMGGVTLKTVFLTCTLPTLMGNIIGGTVLFTLLAHAQVKQEVW